MPHLTINTDNSGITNEARDPSKYTPRPTRFPIQAPFHYRQSGEPEWHWGTTINISRSGVLFRAENDLAANTVLEMCIEFPTEVTGGVPTRVVCWGPVVRKGSPDLTDSRPALAAAISRYRFGHD